MTRSILLVAAGILAAALFACAAPSGSPPAPRIAANCTFNASSVGVLASGYTPDPDSNTYSIPGRNLQAGISLSTQMLNDINAAFTNAPLAVQNDICALSGIFIDTSSCQGGTINPCTPINNNVPVSWGYRSYNRADLGSMYIAIPASLWPSANYMAMPLTQYEQNAAQYFALNAGNPYWGSKTTPTYALPTISSMSYNNPGTSWPTVLAALAHELGHVKLNYTIHKQNHYGEDYDFSSLHNCNTGSTTIDFFTWWTYSGSDKKLFPKGSKGYWRQFGYQDNQNSNKRIDHSLPPYLSDFSDLAHYPNPNPLLYALYANDAEPWASFWGAWSPDEDFVETYVLFALLNNMTSLQISISGYSPYDIIANTTSNNKPVLYSKIQCVANLPTI
jgi:hypothetical protein